MIGKIRVLHVIPNLGPGGAERMVVDLLESCNRERFDMAAVSLYPQSGTILEQEILKKGLPIYYLDKHRGLDLRMIPQLRSFFRAYKPEVVHTHRYVMRYTLLPTLSCRIPVCVHTVHTIAQKEVQRIGRIVHWYAFRHVGVVPVSISQVGANTFHDVYGRGIETPVIYNGIPTAYFVSTAKRAHGTARRGDVVLLHIGRFTVEKNHALLIEAFMKAAKEHSSMRLWLVGDGELRTAVEKGAAQRDLKEKISFLGIRGDVADLLAKCDIFVLSSDYEGAPITVIEAMAAARPVIATAVGGVPEIIDDGASGILVPRRNPELLARAIVKLAKDPELRQRMGLEGQRRALARFDISHTARNYETLYLKLLKARRKL